MWRLSGNTNKNYRMIPVKYAEKSIGNAVEIYLKKPRALKNDGEKIKIGGRTMINEQELLENASSGSRKNYERNCRRKQPSGLINGQKNCAVSGYSIGIAKVSHGGCGPIAVYNALQAAGRGESFPLIVLGFERYALRAGGLLGGDPGKMERFFRECKIAAIRSESYDDFVSVMRAVKVGIICYWTAKPGRSLLHFAAVVNMGEKGYAVCNRYSDRKTPSAVKSIEALCPPERFVNGFFMS